jgi:5-aminopentanamidase
LLRLPSFSPIEVLSRDEGRESLANSGYSFADQIGTEWIQPQPDSWMRELCQQIARQHVAVFLSHPERDAETGKLCNSVLVIGTNGTILGTHRKINALRVGSEAWSSPGHQTVPISVPPLNGVGILICADAYSPAIAQSLKAQGAQLLVSSAAWGPGFHGPNGEWERCTRDTGLALLVCNRTGPDQTLNFTDAESVIVKDGQRLLSFQAERSTVFTIDWDLERQNLATQQYQRIDLEKAKCQPRWHLDQRQPSSAQGWCPGCPSTRVLGGISETHVSTSSALAYPASQTSAGDVPHLGP